MYTKFLLIVGCATTGDASLKNKSIKPTLFNIRQGLPNALKKLKAGKNVTIAYFGGSITDANGWRSMTFEWFGKTYPKAKLKQIHAAIGGTGSQLGVFRMDRDILPHKPDLVFVEFAVNDCGQSFESIIDTMEGIVRKIRTQDATTDICFFYTIRQQYFKDYDAKTAPVTIRAMEAVAEHYGILIINGGYKAYQLVRENKIGFPEITKDKKLPMFSEDECHPNSYGHSIYSELITDVISKMPVGKSIVSYELTVPLSKTNYEKAKMLKPSEAMTLSSGWKRHSEHEYNNRFDEFWTGESGDSATIRFKGSDLLIYDLIGTDTGQFEVFVDGKSTGNILRFDKFCSYHRLHWAEIVSGLDPDKVHEVTIKILPTPPTAPLNTKLKSKGTNINIGAILLRGELVK